MPIVAQIILKNSEGKSILDAQKGILASDIGSYFVDDDRIRSLEEKLVKLGFKVLSNNKTSLSVEATTKIWEDVFKVRYSNKYPEKDVVVPDCLSGFIAGVVFVVAPDFY